VHPLNRRALSAGLLTVVLATTGCGSDGSKETAQSATTTAAATEAKSTPAEMMEAKRTKVQKCLVASGHDAKVVNASEMDAPADIKAFVEDAGAGVLHLDERKRVEGPQPNPAVDILVSTDKQFDPAFGTRVVDWLDDRAGVSDEPMGEGPSSDIAAPSGPMGIFEGPNLDGITAIVYDAPPRGFHNKLVGCNVLDDGMTTLDRESQERQSNEAGGVDTGVAEQDGPTSSDAGGVDTDVDEQDGPTSTDEAPADDPGGAGYQGDGESWFTYED
jgi:hypothetical protein